MPALADVADFACPSHRVVVEVDGGQHGAEAHLARDARHDASLAALGWRVLRFWTAEVAENQDAVLWRVGQAVGVSWEPI